MTWILFEEIRHLSHKKFVFMCNAQTLCPISVWGDEALSVQSSSLSVMLKTYTHGASSPLGEILTPAVGPPHEKPTLLLCFRVQFQRFFPSPDLYSHELTRGLAHKGEDTNVAVGSPWPIPAPPFRQRWLAVHAYNIVAFNGLERTREKRKYIDIYCVL